MAPITLLPLGEAVLERMVRAVEMVRERLLKVAGALEREGIPYAIIGGNAVAAWVARVDPKSVRNTQDVDILLAREDLDRAKVAVEAVGFFYHETLDVHMFLETADPSPQDGVHILFAGEKVRPDYAAPTPTLAETESGPLFRMVTLEALLRMKLTSYRRKDQVHIQDLIRIGLIDATWPARFIPELAARLQVLIDDPNG